MHHITLQIQPPQECDDDGLTGIRESLAMAVESAIGSAVHVPGFMFRGNRLIMRMTADYAPKDARQRLREAMRNVNGLDVTVIGVVDADRQMIMEG